MSYDSRGNFNRVHSWENDRLNNVEIASDRHDEEDDNFAQGLSMCVLRDGRAAMSGNLNLNNYRIQNVAGGTASSDAVNKAQLDAVNSTLTAFIQSKIDQTLSALYPVGSIYIGTQNSCPLATLIAGSTWTLVGQNRALWGGNGSNGNTTINAGLPNITGRYNHQCLMNWGSGTENGALYTANVSGDSSSQNGGGSDGGNSQTIAFDASKSNSIYGASTTVQPPAYRVNVWRRTA